ncbi:MAG: DUF1036 domain-containing protein [Aestuariivirga sp.]|uniref:DUF1036 domain-containing protein n=1 Tax=Aestuariivirga sp. TaxID=2650926 RepID=UPI0025C20B92|nr:DUF1036 domain-containing protein [Aestuariivirga sp.]MCA3562031.1 DUF1036 domain-containing protein [Aestuariivirga sp.]
MLRNTALAAGAFMVAGLMAAPARADLKVCNNTESTVNVAMGYKDKNGWATEGWWTIVPNKCMPLLKGDLISRYYYVFAIDRDKGGSWGGKSVMCTNTKVFTIRGIKDCESQGYTKTGFFEVDTGEEKDWTVSLSGEKTTQGK